MKTFTEWLQEAHYPPIYRKMLYDKFMAALAKQQGGQPNVHWTYMGELLDNVARSIGQSLKVLQVAGIVKPSNDGRGYQINKDVYAVGGQPSPAPPPPPKAGGRIPTA